MQEAVGYAQSRSKDNENYDQGQRDIALKRDRVLGGAEEVGSEEEIQRQ